MINLIKHLLLLPLIIFTTTTHLSPMAPNYDKPRNKPSIPDDVIKYIIIPLLSDPGELLALRGVSLKTKVAIARYSKSNPFTIKFKGGIDWNHFRKNFDCYFILDASKENCISPLKLLESFPSRICKLFVGLNFSQSENPDINLVISFLGQNSPSFPNLTHLDVSIFSRRPDPWSYYKISCDQIESIANIKTITHLSLDCNNSGMIPPTDRTHRNSNGSTSRCSICPKDLLLITTLPNLTHLNIQYSGSRFNPINSQEDTNEFLKGLKGLKCLDLRQTNVTDEFKRAAEKFLPETDVKYQKERPLISDITDLLMAISPTHPLEDSEGDSDQKTSTPRKTPHEKFS